MDTTDSPGTGDGTAYDDSGNPTSVDDETWFTEDSDAPDPAPMSDVSVGANTSAAAARPPVECKAKIAKVKSKPPTMKLTFYADANGKMAIKTPQGTYYDIGIYITSVVFKKLTEDFTKIMNATDGRATCDAGCESTGISATTVTIPSIAPAGGKKITPTSTAYYYTLTYGEGVFNRGCKKKK